MTDDNNSDNDNANGNGDDNDTLPPPHIYVHLFFFFLTRSCPPAQRPSDLLDAPIDAIVALAQTCLFRLVRHFHR